MEEKHTASHALDTPGSMREYLPSQEALNDPSSKQRIRKQPKAGKVSSGTQTPQALLVPGQEKFLRR